MWNVQQKDDGVDQNTLRCYESANVNKYNMLP